MAVGFTRSGLQSVNRKNKFAKPEETNKQQPMSIPSLDKQQQPMNTVDFGNSRFGDVIVDGQKFSRQQYNALLNQQGAASQQVRGGKDFERIGEGLTPNVKEFAAKQKETATGEIFKQQTEAEAKKQLAIEEYKATHRSASEIKKQQDLMNLPNTMQVGTDEKPVQPDILDVSTIIGSTGAGAAAGAQLGSRLGVVGAIGGGILGGLAGLGTSYFASVGGERKQQVKVSNAKFKQADQNIQMLFNDAYSGDFSLNYLQSAYDYEWERMKQAEREIAAQQKELFGEKLSRSKEELALIQDTLRRKARMDIDFQFALANPDPTKVVKITPYDNSESNGVWENLFG